MVGGRIQPFFIHEFPALEGKIEQFAKSLAFTRRRRKVPPYPAENKNEMKGTVYLSFPFKKSLPVVCLS
jgi:hypothetical protein